MLRDRADFIQRRQPIKPESMLLSYQYTLDELSLGSAVCLVKAVGHVMPFHTVSSFGFGCVISHAVFGRTP